MEPTPRPDLTDLSHSCFDDSRRWFPDLHPDDMTVTLVHMTLGLAGEVGELCDRPAFTTTATRSELIDVAELPDVVIYALNIAACLDVDVTHHVHVHVPKRLELASTAINDVVVASGTIANIVKKLNRADVPDITTGWTGDVSRAIATIMHRCEWIAERYDVDLWHMVASKREVNAGRFG